MRISEFQYKKLKLIIYLKIMKICVSYNYEQLLVRIF